MFKEYKDTINSMPEKEISILGYGYDLLKNAYPPISKKDQKYDVVNVRDSSENPKISRNSLCICGSSKKYKNCCLKSK